MVEFANKLQVQEGFRLRAAAPDPHDHGGHGGRDGSPDCRGGRRREEPLRDRIVIAAEMSIGTIFTLFVTPAIYTLIARIHGGKRGGGIMARSAAKWLSS